MLKKMPFKCVHFICVQRENKPPFYFNCFISKNVFSFCSLRVSLTVSTQHQINTKTAVLLEDGDLSWLLKKVVAHHKGRIWLYMLLLQGV